MEIENATAFGQVIRAARRRHRMTQRELALIAGTGERFVVDLEGGKPTMQLGRAIAVAVALGLSFSLTDPEAEEAEAPP